MGSPCSVCTPTQDDISFTVYQLPVAWWLVWTVAGGRERCSWRIILVSSTPRFTYLTRNIRALDQSHALLPARVMEACIADVEPPGDQGWTRDAAQLMVSLCSSSKYLKAKVVGTNVKLVIKLIACHDDEEVDIGNKLVE